MSEVNINDENETYNISVRKGVKGYVGYFVINGLSKSTKITRKCKSDAKTDAIKHLIENI